MEFLASKTGQEMYAQKNAEYPVKPGIGWSDLQDSWGGFKEDSLSLSVVADNRATAIKLADEVGYND
jgi:iron(III) transport system substrate-binding protein